ncbi:hypothetical protein [Bryobacter aggregatus]|uniref:hypothetical protein n=1 Tax=Bryobacter aggregatus TaxID=360054 RepID=UPI0004E1DB1E|nr:hypothetical protein [Bryobacter aggregatus]
MTPLQLLPPVKPSEAVAIADLVFKITRGRVWSNDLRGLLAKELPSLRGNGLQPYPHTLLPHPANPTSFFLVVAPWLLQIVPSSAPESTLFPSPMLLARARPAGEREILITAIELEANLPTILRHLYPELFARTAKQESLCSIPATDPAAIAFCQKLPKKYDLLPAFRSNEPSWNAYLPILAAPPPNGFVNILTGLTKVPSPEQAAPYTRFSYQVEDPQSIVPFYEALQETLHRDFDLELDLAANPNFDLNTLAIPVHSIEHATAHNQGITLAANKVKPATSGRRTHWKLASWR